MRLWNTVVLCLALIATSADAQNPTVAAPVRNFTARVHALIEAYVSTDAFSGTVLVASSGRIIYRRSYGLANRELNTANRPETKYRIGSLTKQFTAVAILQLVERGKVSLDDRIDKYYPEAPASWSQVTIRRLLSHRSGIYNYTDDLTPASLPWFQVDRSPGEIASLVRDKPLQFALGAEFRYSNTNFVLLGIVIEKASGLKYADYVNANIFKPLGMTNTGYDDTAVILSNRAEGYSKGGKGWSKAMTISMTVPYAAGGLYSTVDDLLKWDQSLYAGKLIGPSSTAAMFTDNGGGYGFGYQVGKTPDGRAVLSHAGGIPGFAAAIQRMPEDRLTVIVLANQDNSPSPKIADEIAGLAHGVAPANPPVIRTAVTLRPGALDRYVGVYAVAPGVDVTIVRKNSGLFAAMTGKGQIELFAESDGRFFSTTADVQFIFKAGANDRSTDATMVLGGHPMALSRKVTPAD